MYYLYHNISIGKDCMYVSLSYKQILHSSPAGTPRPLVLIDVGRTYSKQYIG